VQRQWNKWLCGTDPNGVRRNGFGFPPERRGIIKMQRDFSLAEFWLPPPERRGIMPSSQSSAMTGFWLPLRIPMKADTCSNPCRTPFRSCRTVVGAKRRSLSLINGCPTGVKISPSVLPSFGAPSRGDAWTIHPKTSSRRLFGQAVSGGNQLPNSSSGCRRSLRVTDSPARPNRRALD